MPRVPRVPRISEYWVRWCSGASASSKAVGRSLVDAVHPDRLGHACDLQQGGRLVDDDLWHTEPAVVAAMYELLRLICQDDTSGLPFDVELGSPT